MLIHAIFKLGRCITKVDKLCFYDRIFIRIVFRLRSVYTLHANAFEHSALKRTVQLVFIFWVADDKDTIARFENNFTSVAIPPIRRSPTWQRC